jgi:hypothetical protein
MSATREPVEGRTRLLRHLAEASAFATLSPLGCGRIALFRDVGGTSLGAGHVPLAAAEALLAEGLLRWSGRGRSRRLERVTSESEPKRALVPRLVEVDGVVTPVMVDERESPLLWLHRRKGKDGQPQISAEQFAAGERFRADLTLAKMLPRTTMNWQAASAPDDRGPGARGPAAASDAALAARQRVRLACDRLGPELSGLAIDVCGFLKGLDRVERERGWPARSAKLMLKLALSGLATHYGIALGCRVGAPPRGWHADGARPGIMPAAPGR